MVTRILKSVVFLIFPINLILSYDSVSLTENPDIFIIGCQKCGFSSLAFLLSTHPAICNSGAKEKFFFSKQDYASTYSNYDAQFQECIRDESLLTLDATPIYISDAAVPQRLKETYVASDLSQKKFVLMLRDPLTRQYSEYQRLLRICFKYIDDKSARTNRDLKQKPDTDAMNRCGRLYKGRDSGIKIVGNLTKDEIATFALWDSSKVHYI